ncbi:DUF4304 domain-containing protein [uncultured Paludibaculum sp.]|uniref:DUF4304 domain-containing protein n=1 Tax=uncultured Paludibaculum sp. TaxID=1765020 RepID=UPI00374DF7C7
MTSTISRRVRECVDRAARLAGFVKHSTWFWTKSIEGDSLILIVYLQKSRWGDSFYIELGALFGGTPEKLHIWDAPLRMRVGAHVSDMRVTLPLDFNQAANVEGQLKELGDALEVGLFTELCSIRSRKDLLAFIARCQDRTVNGKRTSFQVSRDFLSELQSEKHLEKRRGNGDLQV